MTERAHETVLSSLYGALAGLMSLGVGGLIGLPAVLGIAIQVAVGVFTAAVSAVAIHYVKKALKKLDGDVKAEEKGENL